MYAFSYKETKIDMMLVTRPRWLPCPYMVLLLKILFQGTSGSDFDETLYEHQRFKPIIFCSNDNPVLILKYFEARSNFATSALICENVFFFFFFLFFFLIQFNVPFKIISLIETSQSV